MVRRPVNVLTRRGRPRWGSREVWLIRSGGLEEGSGGTASQAVASPVTWRSRPFRQRHRLGQTHSRTADKRVLPGGIERINAGDRAEAFFSEAASYLSVEGGGM